MYQILSDIVKAVTLFALEVGYGKMKGTAFSSHTTAFNQRVLQLSLLPDPGSKKVDPSREHERKIIFRISLISIQTPMANLIMTGMAKSGEPAKAATPHGR